jgi:hypothetical protein
MTARSLTPVSELDLVHGETDVRRIPRRRHSSNQRTCIQML